MSDITVQKLTSVHGDDGKVMFLISGEKNE